jgi:hypothetical protein
LSLFFCCSSFSSFPPPSSHYSPLSSSAILLYFSSPSARLLYRPHSSSSPPLFDPPLPSHFSSLSRFSPLSSSATLPHPLLISPSTAQLQGYRPQACVRLQENTTSGLTMRRSDTPVSPGLIM